MSATSPYIGRFAPTPSGHLHFGSLLAALASYLDARHHQGIWLVRMEDLDLPRNKPGAAQQILDTLHAFGLDQDGEVWVQSDRQAYYADQIQALIDQGQAYYCDCSRSDLAPFQGIYPGTCRERHLPAAPHHAVRVLTKGSTCEFVDRLQGPFRQQLEAEVGDFVIRRRDGIVAYQLAVVMDDIAQGVTDVVRGADLLDSTPRQLWLYKLLGAPAPRYLHIPLVVRQQGEKLSKRLGSAGLDITLAEDTLFTALAALYQRPPATLRGASIREQLAWASRHWDPLRLPATLEVPQESLPIS
ncbi:tRNA glutamyl-Q(34) synthetase GluQRS [Halopseudomonas pelagia]|uniref:tRNA glutamyl-Q(34) synthetase GluQRS n=1 Tax=Halopseudomonas pelagia TaxID=553151 RepID=UPI00039E9115|nr:tRNA glutamyl-Q(34) synthetase GluQRS [Halopseudomonas pelagia]